VSNWRPTSTVATRYAESPGSDGAPPKVEMTRPLCPYPEVAAYKGQGDTKGAASFRCVAR
jgi:hypothetical protein